jgi:hypothetical protein
VYGYLCEPWSLPATRCCDLDALGVPQPIQELAHEAASEALWLATGQRFGNCAVTLRPCRRDCHDTWPAEVAWSDGIIASHWGYPWPTLRDGVWVNFACGQCVGECSCTSFSEVRLPDPVHEVVEVRIDGEVLPATGYVLYDSQRLVKTVGEWPTCQDWTVTGGPGAWSVSARFGEEVPALGTLAVDKYTCELAKACVGAECELPPYATEVTRQGVRFTLKPTELLQDGLTGVLLPDLFIARFNPRGLQDRARAYSPDVPLPRVQP